MNTPTPKLLTQQQAAEHLGVSERLVRKLIDTRQLPSVKVGRLVRVSDAALLEYVEHQTRQVRR